MRIFGIAETDAEHEDVVRRYVDREITAEQAADRLGLVRPSSMFILEAERRFGRLPDQRDGFTDGEFKRAEVARPW